MIKLSDTQCILLSNASQRSDGSILPLPTMLSESGGTTKAVNALIARGYAEERETDAVAAVHKTDGDVRWGIFMTPTGAAAIGVCEEGSAVGTVPRENTVSPTAPIAKGPTKAALVVALLERSEGATLPDLIDATGWLPHTTRAALTGIRKKGHIVERMKRDGVTCYRIAVTV